MFDGFGNLSAPPPSKPHGADRVTILAAPKGTTAVLPAGYPLKNATFGRFRGHLSVTAPGRPEVVVPRFFSHPVLTTLATEDGAELSRHMVLLMSNLSDRMEHALRELAIPRGGEA